MGRNDKLNICQVIFSEGWGGAETVVHELAKNLAGNGENVSIILNREIRGYFIDLENVEVLDIGPLYSFIPLSKSIMFPWLPKSKDNYHLHDPVIMRLFRTYPQEFLKYIYFRRIRKKILQFLSDNHVDILHCHMNDAASLVSELGRLKIPIIATPHGEHTLIGNVHTRRLLMPLEKWKARKYVKTLKKATRVLHVSNYMFDDCVSRGFSSVDRGKVIYNAINISEVQEGAKSPLELKGRLNLLFPGGVKAIKRGDLVIESLTMVKRQVDDVHLYIALDVPSNHLMRKRVKDLGLQENVTFVGFLPPKEYKKLLSSVDLLVLPSRLEAFPMVCLEAMALGKPIVATKTGGIPELVKDGRNGILVEGKPISIAEAILSLYRDADLAKEISRHNLQDIVEYDWSLTVSRYIEFYRDMLMEENERTEEDIFENRQKQYYEKRRANELSGNWVTRRILPHMDIEMNVRKDFIISRVKRLKLEIDHELEILDLGCGSAHISKALSKYGNVVGIDQNITSARQLYPELTFEEADIVRDKIDGKYDVVISSEVIEHLAIYDQSDHIVKIRDLMKNNTSLLVLTTPNKPVAEKYYSDFNITHDKLQPIENWLDRDSLMSLIEPILEIENVKSILPYSRFKFCSKSKLLRIVVSSFSLFLTTSRMHLFESGDHGIYLAITARKY